MVLEVKNIEHRHTLAILSSFFFFFLASNAFQLRCPGTALIYKAP